MADDEIVVLEPDKAAAGRLTKKLSRWHFGAVACSNLVDAVRYADSPRVSVVIADVKALSPKSRKRVSAGELKRTIGELRRARGKGRKSERDLYVIVTSAREEIAEHAAAMEAGADLYLAEKAARNEKILGAHLERMLRKRADDPETSGDVEEETWAEIFELPTERLRSESGRLDAGRIAEELGVPLKRLAEALEIGYTTVHKTPDSEALQPTLKPYANILAMVEEVFQADRGSIRAWLRTERDVLGGKSPLDALLTPRGAEGVQQLVSSAWMGVPD